jgi:hypothetical protein
MFFLSLVAVTAITETGGSLGYAGGHAGRSFSSPRPTAIDGARKGSAAVQMLTILAVSPESAKALCSSLAAFYPELTTDEDGRCFISFELSGDRAAGVLDALTAYARSNGGDGPVSSVTVSLDEPTTE